MSEHQVDTGVVLNILSDRKVDELGGRRQVGGSGARLHDAKHVAGSNTALEQDSRCAERAGGEDDTAIGGERICAVEGAYTSDLRAGAHEVGHVGVLDQLEVRAAERRLEVSRNGPAALATDVVVRSVSVGMVLIRGLVT